MEYLRARLTRALFQYFCGDDRRIEHALRVLCHADRLAENHPGCDSDIVIASALLHDVGIKVSEEKHGYNNGRTQEEYGPPAAAGILQSIGFPPRKIEIVQNIVGNHHSPSRYDYPELAVLKEADRIVNRDEDGQPSLRDSGTRAADGTASAAPPAMPVLEVEDLRVAFRGVEGEIRAVDGISFHIHEDETVALVGESGCGKSVASLALARLVAGAGHSISGSIRLGAHDVLGMPERDLRRLRGSMISYVFQDATSALNPVQTVGSQIAEAIRLHRQVPDVTAEVIRLMKLVGLPEAETRRRDYPHQFSGGMQQRVMLAMALACHPKVLVADEPTTALDVTIQAQIFRLLRRLREELRMAVLLITHNLGLVAENADRVHVMYAGRLMETGTTADVLRRSRHPYTQGLLKAVPRMAGTAERMTGIRGTVPHPARLPAGCRFHPRCDLADERCRGEEPEMLTIAKGHGVRCHYWKQVG